MNTNDHEPEPYEREAFTQPDIHLPDDGKWEWMLWVAMAISGTALSYGVIKLIPILGGILSWR